MCANSKMARVVIFQEPDKKKKEHFEGLGDYDLFCLALNEPMI